MRSLRHRGVGTNALFAILLSASGLSAQTPPGEVGGFAIDPASVLTWLPVSGADDYNVYRGRLAWLAVGDGAHCHGDEIAGTSFPTTADPPVGDGYYYLATAESAVGGEGTAGTASGGAPRELRGRCDAIMRDHLLDRLGFGGDEWTRDRISQLGIQGYIDEQLAPETIDESSNAELNARRAALDPPANINELQGLDVVNAVYARRQLEQQVALFWNNHFNTDYRISFQFFGFYQTLFPLTRLAEATKLHHDPLEAFRDLSFNGTFRDLVEASALSPGMILYLDTDTNVKGIPNENFARELLELHTMGVDGGYTQQDIVELARVFTGWNVCKKSAADAGDPLAACIPRGLYGTPSEPPGLWVNNFRSNLHDTGPKVLFQGTPHQVVIPDTTANPPSGINDVQIALDGIAAHPATTAFIARKLLQKFVTEEPTPAMIDAVVAQWNDASNPMGVGDIREVLRAVTSLAAFRDPDGVGGKLKTPFEHVVSGLRVARGKSDGLGVVRQYLTRMQELPHQNPVPTGYSELGGDWLDTNNLLERQNYGLDMTSRTASSFGADVIGLLNDHGVSTAPGNATAIVSFIADVMFGGGLTASEVQAAVDHLNTDDNGLPSSYNNARIREAFGFMMGFAQFLEQ